MAARCLCRYNSTADSQLLQTAFGILLSLIPIQAAMPSEAGKSRWVGARSAQLHSSDPSPSMASNKVLVMAACQGPAEGNRLWDSPAGVYTPFRFLSGCS